MSDIQIRPAHWSSDEDRAALIRIRSEVFLREQGVPKSLEWDGRDETAEHFLALSNEGQAIGCARLLPDNHLGRIAVLKEWRGQGVGSALVSEVIKRVGERGADELHISAQTRAQPFYRRFNFESQGMPYMDAGIPHRDMLLVLPKLYQPKPGVDNSDENQGDVASEFADQFLGQTMETLRLTRRRHYGELILRMASQARRNLYIFTPSLERSLFGSEALVRSCFDLARNHPKSHVHIVVHDTRQALKEFNPMIDLAKDLSSYVKIRNTGEEYLDDNRTLVIADDCGYILRRGPDRYEGEANFNNPLTTRRHLEYFTRLWHYAVPDPYTRHHHI